MTREVTHGADDVLKGVFWDLAQIGEAGEPKYPESILKRLAAKILDGRAHEPLVFRLCHLVRCAELASARGGERYGWLEFFCAPRAGRADWAAGWMRARLPSPDEGETPAAAADHVALRFEGRAEPIGISYGAMPLLAAFMEFLLNTLGYGAVREGVALLLRPHLTWKELQETANALSRAVYAWLREHTRPVQESRDFDEIVGFLLTRGGGDDFGAGDVDDAAILDFWRAASLEPTSGFLTYRKTFRAFLRFADALRDEALHGGGAETGGLALGDGWYEPPDPASPGIERMRAPSASRVAWGADDDEGLSPIEELESVDIKFLLAGEARRLAPLAAHRRAVAALARSLLRDAGFGHAQGRISQALRMKDADVAAVIGEPLEVRYEDEAASYARLLNHLDDLIAAAAYVLLGGENGPGRALDFATLSRGRRALKDIRRKGFDNIRSRESGAVEALRAAAPAILTLRERLSTLCARLAAEEAWAARQREDEPVFREQFIRIYGSAGTGDKETVS